MCGRFTLRANSEELTTAFNAELKTGHLPRFNIAPSQECPVIRQENRLRLISSLRWGFVPHWAKDPKIGFKMINARSEEISRSYQSSLKSQRCLIPVDGWYEWKNKRPFHFSLPDNQLFAFAGIWARWQDIETFSIFTTSAIGIAAEYHARMPVILPSESYDAWLDPAICGTELIGPLLQPWSGTLQVVAANPCVGNVRNDSPRCLVSPQEKSQSLFDFENG